MLVRTLGEGHHFGEWYGQKIARNYGLKGRRFALFNVNRYAHVNDPTGELIPGLETVPVLYTGPFNTRSVEYIYDDLMSAGFQAVPGFMNPEARRVWVAREVENLPPLSPENDQELRRILGLA